MAHHDNQPVDIHDEVNYDPTVWVPRAHSHGTKALWKTFWLLFVVTILDIILYFSLPAGMGRNITFIALGVFKAGFIVYVFMHLSYEKKWLQSIIVYPMIFVIYLIAFMLKEASFWNSLNW
ncbi:MAG: cytochrome c oxidase subunit 4 [Bacteroidia bacterium]|jgi:cytochrome c oxidase subunit 4